MGRYRPIRIAFLVLLLVLMVLVPWVAVCFVVIVAALRYRLFLEALVAGFIFDVWFGGANAHYGIFTALIILVAAELITRFLGVRRA